MTNVAYVLRFLCLSSCIRSVLEPVYKKYATATLVTYRLTLPTEAPPLEHRNRADGSYIVVDMSGITVYSLAGTAKYRVTYAKLNEQELLLMEQALIA